MSVTAELPRAPRLGVSALRSGRLRSLVQTAGHEHLRTKHILDSLGSRLSGTRPSRAAGGVRAARAEPAHSPSGSLVLISLADKFVFVGDSLLCFSLAFLGGCRVMVHCVFFFLGCRVIVQSLSHVSRLGCMNFLLLADLSLLRSSVRLKRSSMHLNSPGSALPG